VKFDEMVADGRMPKAKRIDSRKVWDRRALDQAFDALGDGEQPAPTGWEDFLDRPRSR
jgi:RNA polymerase-interacting CarD/CdnL/TRCF family regulator